MHRNPSFAFDSLEHRRLRAADLAITAVTLANSATSTDGYVEYSVTVQNVGNKTALAGRTVINVNLSADKKFRNRGNDRIWDQAFLGKNLQPGERTTIGFTHTQLLGNQGLWKVAAMVNGDHTIAETNYDNNVAFSSTFIYYDPIENGTVSGTSGNDRMALLVDNDRAVAIVNGAVYGRRLNGLPADGLTVEAGDGNDRVVASADFPVKLSVNGGLGKDVIVGGAANDALYGGGGIDRLYGGAGNDLLSGGASSDRLFGELGNDTLYGNNGHDRMYGNEGVNRLEGGAGVDRLFTSGNGQVDSIDGGAGDDIPDTDSNDVVTAI